MEEKVRTLLSRLEDDLPGLAAQFEQGGRAGDAATRIKAHMHTKLRQRSEGARGLAPAALVAAGARRGRRRRSGERAGAFGDERQSDCITCGGPAPSAFRVSPGPISVEPLMTMAEPTAKA